MSKKIALLCQHFYPEMVSTGMHMTELSSRLTELGWDITVYCARPGWGSQEEYSEETIGKESYYRGIRIVRVPTVGDQQRSIFARMLFAFSFLLTTTVKLCREHKYYSGLVLTTNPPFLGLTGWLFSRIYHKPYLLIVYDVYPDIAVKLGVLRSNSWLAWLWRKITHFILAEASVVVVIGRDMQRIIQAKLPSNRHDRIVLIPNWSDERTVKIVSRENNSFATEHNPEKLFVVQYAGRMGRTHNLEPLIEAARLMRDEKVLFQFIGEGAKKKVLEKLVENAGLDNVQFLPYQPMERLAEMLCAADLSIACLEQGFEGLSVPSKSYGVIASGTPLLALLERQSEIGQMVEESGCGVVLPDPAAAELAETIRGLIAEPATLKEMGEAGRKAFLNNFTLSHAAHRYEIALTGMLEQQLPVSLNYTEGILGESLPD